jgi:hypothetical protein
MFMTEDLDFMDLIEKYPGIITYKALFITDNFSLFYENCKGKTVRIDLQILSSYVLDNNVILLNIRSRKLKSYIKNFISSCLFDLYIHTTGDINISPRNVLKQLNINIRDIDSPPKDLLQDSLLIFVQKDYNKIIVKECDDRLARLDL